MGFFGNLNADAYDRQYTDRALVARMAAYFRPHRGPLTVVAITLIVSALLDTALPLILAAGVSALSEQPELSFFLVLAGALLLTEIAVWTINYVRRRLTTRAIGDVILALRTDAFRAAMGQDLSFYDKNSSGRLVSRITSDTQEFANVTVLVTDTLSQLISVVLLTIVLARADWRLTLLLWGVTIPVFLVAGGFRQLARRVTRQGTRAMANVNASIQETVSGIGVAKNFRQEGEIYADFRETNRESYRINLRRGFVLAAVFPTLWVVGGIAAALLVYYGGLSVGAGAISAGAWYLFIQGVERFFFPFMNLASFWPQVQSGLSAAERVFALIDAEPAVQQVDRQPVAALQGRIEFEHVRFQYSDKEVVLPDFSLQIKPGETIALVGHTGAGKSSIGRLIARFYEFQDGRICIDGRDIRTLDLAQYRRQLGIVSQVPFLFAGTVADNIRYVRPEMRDDEIAALARQIGQGEWLDTLPDGLRTDVGQRGARLSLGQRQLVALVRVLAQKPAIFILDEATASIDPFTEEQIQCALDLLLKQSTSIVIAHRLSTVRSADRILVLRKGVIIEQGNHDQLLSQNGHYAELYNTYFRHQSLEALESYGRLKAGVIP